METWLVGFWSVFIYFMKTQMFIHIALNASCLPCNSNNVCFYIIVTIIIVKNKHSAMSTVMLMLCSIHIFYQIDERDALVLAHNKVEQEYREMFEES